MRRSVLTILALALLTACYPAGAETPVAPAPTPPPQASPSPIRLPEDEAPHDVLTEWWYYTGHLKSAEGHEYGFEFVIFQSRRGQNPIGYLAHFAITDARRGIFRYGARAVQQRQAPAKLDLAVAGWRLQGNDGRDHFTAELDEYGLELSLAPQKPPVLHHGGYISFGPAGESYYYSRTRAVATGRLRVGDTWHPVIGQAWHDHQWGNYIVPSVGGWDWFSLQLDDGTELMLAEVRDPSGGPGTRFGTYVDRAGRAIDLGPDDLTIEPLAFWESPHTGARYPSGWQVRVMEDRTGDRPSLALRLTPVLQDQELAFERMPYWEGAVRVEGQAGETPVTGLGYVELTGYH